MWSDAIASNGFASCAGTNKGLLGSQVADGGKQLLRRDGGKAHSEARALRRSYPLQKQPCYALTHPFDEY